MPMITPANDLYDLLVTRDFEPEILDASGKSVTNPAEAEMFSFDWKTPTQNYGTVVILLGSDNNLEVYFGDNLGRAMEGQDKQDWYSFLEQMKKFATSHLLTFEVNNLSRLKYTMQGMAAIKEGLFEGYYGTRKVSYSDQPKKTKLVIRHNRTLGEGDARYRYIESLFVETDQGERFKLPFTKLIGGRAMARHVAEGGRPYDAFGQHISNMMSEMNTLSKFLRAARTKKAGDDARALIETAIRHYQDLKAKAKSIISHRGYHEAKNNFDPAEFTDTEVAVEAVRDMFIEQNIDRRIEEALPILARLSQEETQMQESEMFEQWADRMVEGTWSLPNTTEQQKRLQDLMSRPLLVGPDGANASEQLYDLIGDDQLFDILLDISLIDPDANVWDDSRVWKRLDQLGIARLDGTENAPQAEIEKASGPETSKSDMEEDLDTDGIMMNRPSNMSSEGIERLKHLSKIV